MGYVNVSIEQYRMNFMQLHSAKRYTILLNSCRLILMCGWNITTIKDHIQANIAMVKHLCRLGITASILQKRSYYPIIIKMLYLCLCQVKWKQALLGSNLLEIT
jgi:hypothetical protein